MRKELENMHKDEDEAMNALKSHIDQLKCQLQNASETLTTSASKG